MLFPTLYSRDWTYSPSFGRTINVTGMSWDVFGGPQTAVLEATGGVTELATLFNWLRFPVEVKDAHGRDAWWGYVNAVYVRNGPIEIGVSLDEMTNSVKVAYSYISPGTNVVGTRKVTSAVTSADSIAEYGTKEGYISQGGLTDAAATALATRYLADHKFPRGVASVDGTGRPYGYMPAQRAAMASVRIECKGWIDTLKWRFATVEKTGPKAEVSGTAQALGDNAARTKVLQQFTVGTTGIYVVGATFRAAKVGAPTDNVTMEVYALDGSGNPTGSALATGAAVSGTLLSTAAYANYRDDFTTPVTLTANVQYGLVLTRSGAVDGTNYYNLAGDSAVGYTGGAAKLWNGSAWGAAIAAWDAYFRVNINPLLETTLQVKDLETTYGEFLTYTDIITASGVSIGANRDGDQTVYDVVRELLSYGGPNDRLMTATVTPQRVLAVDEEEASTSYAYYIDTSGRVISTGEVVQPPYMPPVGRWVKIKDFIPGAGGIVYMADATMQFIEGADWSSSGGLTLRFRGQPAIEDITRLAGAGGY